MNHAEHQVDIVDINGEVVGTKKRKDIDKQSDLYHTVFIMLRTPDNKLVLSKIPRRDDLPNLYSGRLGPTASTIRRHKESPDEASKRAVKNELFIEDVDLMKVGETYIDLPDNHKKYMSVYTGTHSLPGNYSHTDIENLLTFSKSELIDEVNDNRDTFALSFMAIWNCYGKALF